MKIFKGVGGAPGINCGVIMLFQKNNQAFDKDISFDDAVKAALGKVNVLYDKALAGLGNESAKIFTAYKMLLEDNALIQPIKSLIESGTAPDDAVLKITEQMSSILSSKQNEYMQQRADDIRYIGQLLTDALHGDIHEIIMPENNDKIIVVAKELTPVDTMQFDAKRLAGLVTEHGGITSHTVILAKSLGIPAIVGVEDALQCKNGDIGFIDGYNGEFVVNADNETQISYNEKIREENRFIKEIEKYKREETYTKDGKRIFVSMNIGNPSDLKNTDDLQYDGIGLFRSEFLYSSTSLKPSMEEQQRAYKTVIEKVYPCPVTIRTIDVGGDKQIEYLNMKQEENPFLGNRGIRLCIQNPDIFKEQLEAIITSAKEKPVKIMLPMITSLEEIVESKKMIAEIQKSTCNENKKISLGIMIETPASAIMAEELAKHCDFFSIGTNDLVQYITAADRGNSDVEHIYNPFNPAVIRTLKYIISSGEKAGIEVSVCGDLAANTDFTTLLLGLGLKKFSVPAPMIPRIKHKISSTDLNHAQCIAEKAVKSEREDEIYSILTNNKHR